MEWPKMSTSGRALGPKRHARPEPYQEIKVLCIGSQEIPTLSELAALFKLSVRQLTRGFRASRGCSIGDYVANSRIERAKRLLASDQSIKTIAYALGFNSSSGFCFAFRRATGMTPGEFRASGAARRLTSGSVLRWKS
jgi:AraC-like DNA-binding protein